MNRGPKINPKRHERLDYDIATFKLISIRQNCSKYFYNIQAKNSTFQAIKETSSKFVTHFSKRATEMHETKLRLLVATENNLDVKIKPTVSA